MEFPAEVASAEHAVEYERDRFRHADQRLIHWLESRAVDAMLERTSLRDALLLDAPCGYGRFTDGLMGKGARSIVAADLSEAMARRTNERCEAAVCLQADITRLPFRDGEFDGVVVMRLLHHLDAEKSAAVLSEVARITADWALVSAYATVPLHTGWRRLQGRGPKGAPRADILEWIRAAGFRIEQVRPILRLVHAQRIFLLRKG